MVRYRNLFQLRISEVTNNLWRKTCLEWLTERKDTKVVMFKACTYVIDTGISKKKASATFVTPRSSNQFRLSAKFLKATCGLDPVLAAEEENKLVPWVLDYHRKRFPVR